MTEGLIVRAKIRELDETGSFEELEKIAEMSGESQGLGIFSG